MILKDVIERMVGSKPLKPDQKEHFDMLFKASDKLHASLSNNTFIKSEHDDFFSKMSGVDKFPNEME